MSEEKKNPLPNGAKKDKVPSTGAKELIALKKICLPKIFFTNSLYPSFIDNRSQPEIRIINTIKPIFLNNRTNSFFSDFKRRKITAGKKTNTKPNGPLVRTDRAEKR